MNHHDDDVQRGYDPEPSHSDFRDALWRQRRKLGKAARADFTDSLRDHGVRGSGYGTCTNKLYVGYVGMTAPEWRAAIGAPAGASLRDHLPTWDLVWVAACESLSARDIRAMGVRGIRNCASVAMSAGRRIRNLLQSSQSPLAAANENDAHNDAA